MASRCFFPSTERSRATRTELPRDAAKGTTKKKGKAENGGVLELRSCETRSDGLAREAALAEASRVLREFSSVSPEEWLAALERLALTLGEARRERNERRRRTRAVHLEMLLATEDDIRRRIRERGKAKKREKEERGEEKERRDAEERLSHGRPVWRKHAPDARRLPREGEGAGFGARSPSAASVSRSSSPFSARASLRLHGGLPVETLLWRYGRYLPHLSPKQLVRFLLVVERLDFHDGRSPQLTAFLPFAPPSLSSAPFSPTPAIPPFASSELPLAVDLRAALLGAFLDRLSQAPGALSLKELAQVARFFSRERLPEPAVPLAFFAPEGPRPPAGRGAEKKRVAEETDGERARQCLQRGGQICREGQTGVRAGAKSETVETEAQADERSQAEAQRGEEAPGAARPPRVDERAREAQAGELDIWAATPEGKPLVVSEHIRSLFEILLKAALKSLQRLEKKAAEEARELRRRTAGGATGEVTRRETSARSLLEGVPKVSVPPACFAAHSPSSGSLASPEAAAVSLASPVSPSAESSSPSGGSSRVIPRASPSSLSSPALRELSVRRAHANSVFPLLEACGKLQFVSLHALYAPLLSRLTPTLLVSRSLLALSKTVHFFARVELPPGSHPEVTLPLLQRLANPDEFDDLLRAERSPMAAQVALGELALATVLLEPVAGALSCDRRRLFAEVKGLQEGVLANCLRAVALHTRWNQWGTRQDAPREETHYEIHSAFPSRLAFESRSPSSAGGVSALSCGGAAPASAPEGLRGLDREAAEERDAPGEDGGNQQGLLSATAARCLGEPSAFLGRQLQTVALAVAFEFPLLVARLQRRARESREESQETHRAEAPADGGSLSLRADRADGPGAEGANVPAQACAGGDRLPLFFASSPPPGLAPRASSSSAATGYAARRAFGADADREAAAAILQMLRQFAQSAGAAQGDAPAVQKESSLQHSRVSAALRALGVTHQVEAAYGPYLLDLALTDARICIEVDGPLHFTDGLRAHRAVAAASSDSPVAAAAEETRARGGGAALETPEEARSAGAAGLADATADAANARRLRADDETGGGVMGEDAHRSPRVRELLYDSKSRLKHRILTRAGWQVLHIAWFDWPRRTHNQQEALRQLFRAAAERKAWRHCKKGENTRGDESTLRVGLLGAASQQRDDPRRKGEQETAAESESPIDEKAEDSCRLRRARGVECPEWDGHNADFEAFRVYREQFTEIRQTEQDTFLTVAERLKYAGEHGDSPRLPDDEQEASTEICMHLPTQVSIFPDEEHF
ncbi:RAP domain-containing protein [Besnoitia besnoiti]|uniref:RAP domain-containing protein n=1 Tax=Besnoitia besnoiti TaxID=94643 RepID=A0A2A9MQX4_BESBE|nr:RAP domain-containing protein [Besnoitia besnoiti]PFH38600.1 RAP domain-containing protein [Besnoitia besnoiti]